MSRGRNVASLRFVVLHSRFCCHESSELMLSCALLLRCFCFAFVRFGVGGTTGRRGDSTARGEQKMGPAEQRKALIKANGSTLRQRNMEQRA